jgi:hypothetical protein
LRSAFPVEDIAIIFFINERVKKVTLQRACMELNMLIRQPPASVAGSLLNVFCVSSLLYYKKRLLNFQSSAGMDVTYKTLPGRE